MTNTHDHTDDIRPKPVAQSFWLLASMSAVILVVTVIGQALAEYDPGPTFDGDDLIELAAPSKSQDAKSQDAKSQDAEIGLDPTGPSGSPPALIGAPRIGQNGNTELDGDNQPAAIPFEELTTAEARGRAALATISYPWQQILPDWSIVFLDEKDGLYGLTLVPDKEIEIYVRDSQTKDLLAHVIAHELGHAIDVTLNDGQDRRAWEEARGTKDSQWWPGNGTTDFATGAGDFAESFAAWQVGDGSFRSTLAPPPTEAQIKLLAQLAAG